MILTFDIAHGCSCDIERHIPTAKYKSKLVENVILCVKKFMFTLFIK